MDVEIVEPDINYMDLRLALTSSIWLDNSERKTHQIEVKQIVKLAYGFYQGITTDNGHYFLLACEAPMDWYRNYPNWR